MSQPSSPMIVTIRLATAGRILLFLVMLLAVAGGWFSARWYFGNTISEIATTGDSPNADLARVALRWAPADPFVHWRAAVMNQQEFSVKNLEEALREFETAVRLSPNDFRYWNELGRALEAAGYADKAELAFRRAVALAPSYYYPRWHFGNFLLRQGKPGEAFPELVRAATANEQLWPQVLNLSFQGFDGDIEAIANVACRSPSVCTMFSVYLVGLKRIDDAIRLWKTISPGDRRQAGGEHLRQALLDAKRFQDALEVTRGIEPDPNDLPAADQFWNGGFETNLTLPSEKSFGWVISSVNQVQISISNRAHSGNNTLKLVFSAPNKLSAINVAQGIAITPNTQYHFECFVRTEKLISASTPVVAIFDAGDGAMLAASSPLPTGTHDWQKISLDFKTRGADGIAVMLTRLPCTVGDICPIFGTVWYDDFTLKRAGR